MSTFFKPRARFRRMNRQVMAADACHRKGRGPQPNFMQIDKY
jgi:hypothetical protein